MSIESHIAIRNLDGTYQSVCCRHDGHLEGVGKILKEHYQDENKVRELISNGGMSSLGSEINSPLTVFYHRDRNQELMIHSFNKQELRQFLLDNLFFGIRYFYVFDVIYQRWLYTDLNEKSIDIRPMAYNIKPNN